MKYEKIPKKYHVGGQEMYVCNVERCDGNKLGTCLVAAGRIEVAEIFNKDDKQSDGCKTNTFYHELTHSILDTMGENELSENEKFVCCFSGFLTEAMKDARFIVTDEQDN